MISYEQTTNISKALKIRNIVYEIYFALLICLTTPFLTHCLEINFSQVKSPKLQISRVQINQILLT